jgi:site-specific DNA-cytosine methylase
LHDSRAASAKLTGVIVGRKQASVHAQAQYLSDVALAANFDDLLDAARAAEQHYRDAQATARPLAEQYALAKKLDAALTDVMRSAYAAVRAEIGPRGYDDRIFKRKAMATTTVHALNTEAERLLTLRETHRLTGIPPRPESIGRKPASGGTQQAGSSVVSSV